MTKRFKNFGRPVVQDELEPVGFDLYDEHFDCYKQINGVTLLTFVQNANSDDGARATKALLDIFKHVMNKTEHTRFLELCEDPDTVVPVETLSEIIGFLIEVYTNSDDRSGERPTLESVDS